MISFSVLILETATSLVAFATEGIGASDWWADDKVDVDEPAAAAGMMSGGGVDLNGCLLLGAGVAIL